MKNEATIIGGIGSCTPLLSSPRPRSYSVGRSCRDRDRICIANEVCQKRGREGLPCRKARKAAAAMIRFE